MEIEPDTKDWTWVLERRCPECGVEVSRISGEQLPGLVRDLGRRWQSVLAEAAVRRRPAPAVWSPLEYACHVRDVFDVFDGRLHLMLEQDGAQFDDWDQDAAAVRGRYGEQQPAAVASALSRSAERLATSFSGVGDRWQRRGLRSNGSVFTVLTLGQYLAHDALHHLDDVGMEAGQP